MDLELREALTHFQKYRDPLSALNLVTIMERSGVMPDSSADRHESGPLRCNLDDLGNATAHLEIGPTKLLLFHRTVVAVQTIGQPAVINPDPICRSVTTRKRIREWPFARHTKDLLEGHEFEDLIRFKAV